MLAARDADAARAARSRVPAPAGTSGRDTCSGRPRTIVATTPIRRVTGTAVRLVGGFHRADHASGTAGLVRAQVQESERAAADVRQPERDGQCGRRMAGAGCCPRAVCPLRLTRRGKSAIPAGRRTRALGYGWPSDRVAGPPDQQVQWWRQHARESCLVVPLVQHLQVPPLAEQINHPGNSHRTGVCSRFAQISGSARSRRLAADHLT
jgi:hypothetical protein